MLFDLQAKVGSVSFTTTPFRSSRPSRQRRSNYSDSFSVRKIDNSISGFRHSVPQGHIEGVHRFFQEAERYSMNISAAEQLVLAFEAFELVRADRLAVDQRF